MWERATQEDREKPDTWYEVAEEIKRMATGGQQVTAKRLAAAAKDQ